MSAGLRSSARRLVLAGALAALAVPAALAAFAPAASAMPWAARMDFTVAAGPVAAACADLDGDHLADLVTASRSGDSLSVVFGIGDGVFGRRADLATASQPADLAVADFDGDGRADLAVAVVGGVSLFRGAGGGTFAPRVDLAVGHVEAIGTVSVGDLDDDGHADLVVGDGAGVSILLGAGDGTFAAPVAYPTGIGSNSVVVGDFDGNGSDDVAVANRGDATLTVLLGDGAGGLTPAGDDIGLAQSPADVAAGDLDGDGADDLVVAGDAAGQVGVLLATGAGRFGAVTDYSSGDLPGSVALGDLNGDGRLDVASTATALYAMTAGQVCVRLGDGAGGLGARVDWSTALDARAVALADVTGDGRQDLCAACKEPGVVSVLRGAGDGGFVLEEVVPTGAVATPLAAGDLDGDGELDLVVKEYEALGILLGNGDGSFAPETTLPAAWGGESAVIADLDGDGRADIAEAEADQDTVRVRLGDGAGGFGPPQDHHVAGAPGAIVAADFDGDGSPDLAVADYHGLAISVLLGRGDGTFADSVEYPAEGLPDGIAAGDFDHDGKVDLAVSRDNSWIASEVMVYLGDGDGTFQPRVDYPVGAHTHGVTAADFDLDGALDLVAGGSPVSSLLIGRGDGTFEPRRDAPGAGASAPVAADVDRDGDQDLVLRGGSAVALGDGDGGFAAPFSVGSRADPGGLVPGAFSGAGRLDLVIANAYPATGVRILRDLGPAGTLTVAGGAWCTSEPLVALDSAVPAASQMRLRWWRGDSAPAAGAWTPYQARAGVTLEGADGSYTVCADYRLAGGGALTLTGRVFLDTTAPGAKLTGLKNGGWYRAPVLGKITGDDGSDGSGVAAIAVDVDGVRSTSRGEVAWVQLAAPADHGNDGLHTITFVPTDSAGLAGGSTRAVVGVDTLGPRTRVRSAAGRVGRAVVLSGLVTDALSPKVTGVRVIVSDARGRAVKVIACGARTTGKWFTSRWTPGKRGRYAVKVTALDLAGNRSVATTPAAVVIR